MKTKNAARHKAWTALFVYIRYCSNVNLVDNTVLFGNDSCLQLHGFEYEQRLVLFHFFAFFDEYHSNSADHRKIKAIQSGMRYDYGGY